MWRTKMKNNHIFSAIKQIPTVFRILHMCSKQYIVIMLLETIAFSVDKYPALFLMKYTLEAMTEKQSYTSYWKTILVLVLLMLGLRMLRVVVNTYRPVCDQIVTEKLFEKYFDRCMHVDFQSYESTEFKKQMELAKYMANGKIAAVGWYFVDMFSSLIALVIATILLAKHSVFMVMVCLLQFVCKTYFSEKALKKTLPISEEKVVHQKYLNYLYDIAFEFDYAKDFRLFDYGSKIKEKIKKAQKTYLHQVETMQKMDQENVLNDQVVDLGVKSCSFLMFGWKCMTKSMSIGNFTFCIGIVNDYITYVQTLVSSSKKYAEACKFISYYTEFCLKEKEETTKQIALERGQIHTLEWKNVSFCYPNKKEPALEQVNLILETPFKVSLVGENGAGKTTFVKLLLRLYQPTEGEITLDGINILDYPEQEYMSLVSSVFQDFSLFAFMVKENIASFQKINQEKLKEVSDKTGVCDFIQACPQQFDTYITNEFCNEGYDFSGGERQKIALARAMYKQDALLYILDEPTSAYDALAEYKLYRQYKEMIKDKSWIYISHTFASCKQSDTIILLEKGKITECGTHQQLMQMNGKYKKMYDLQYKKYQEGIE